MTRAGGLAMLLVLAAPLGARANEVVATRCDGTSDAATSFGYTDTVCVAGTVDLVCDGAPGADVYVYPRGAEPWAATPIRVVGPEFVDVMVLSPPLPPGEWDVFLDEGCDAMETEEDLRVDAAFEVGGELACEAPGPPIDPGLDNGATCRGACGAGCPGACVTDTTTVCVDDASSCQHQECAFEVTTCPSHEGCRSHDSCYDDCVRSGGGFLCHRRCDLDCVNSYGLPCGGWAVGRGPSDGELTYYGPATSSGATSGLCSGGC